LAADVSFGLPAAKSVLVHQAAFGLLLIGLFALLAGELLLSRRRSPPC
jgi:hypothetical protein